jgi:hypothetical protein
MEREVSSATSRARSTRRVATSRDGCSSAHYETLTPAIIGTRVGTRSPTGYCQVDCCSAQGIFARPAAGTFMK